MLSWALACCAALVGALALGGVLILLVGLVGAPGAVSTQGLGAAVLGSVALVAVALLGAVPIGVGAGVFLGEYGRTAVPGGALRGVLRDVSAVPSLVHGVFGFAVFGGLLGLGFGAATAGLTLALVVLPGIVEATEDAVRRVPARQREAALALGASPFQVVRSVVLPGAMRGIGGGAMRAAARALGEAAPLLVVGAVLAPLPGQYAAVPHRLYALADTGTREPFALALALTGVVVLLAVGSLRLGEGVSR